MAGKVTIDLDALIPKRDEERIVTLGGREFNVTEIPVGVAAAFLRKQTDATYQLSDAMIDGSVAMLNQKLPDKEKIDKAWFLGIIDGGTLEAVTDIILHPFYIRKTTIRENQREQAKKDKEQNKIV